MRTKKADKTEMAVSEAAGEQEPAAQKEPRKRKVWRSYAMVIAVTFLLTLSLSWRLQPRIIKSREDTAKWETLIWLAKMPSSKREELFQKAIMLDQQAREYATKADEQQKGDTR